MSRRRSSLLTYLTILALTVLVWAAFVLSEEDEYPLQARVEMTGFDVRQYAVVEADSTLSLTVHANGFSALWFGLRNKVLSVTVPMDGSLVRTSVHTLGGRQVLRRAVALADLGETLRDQLSAYGFRSFASPKDSLQLQLSPRSSKTFRPDISQVRISFAEGVGLYGEPRVTPAEVTLYGPAEVLDKITDLRLAPVTLGPVSASGVHRVALDTDWKGLGDLYASTEEVGLYIPVEQYVEREYVVPVTVDYSTLPEQDAAMMTDTSTHLKLYPDRVNLHVWVAQRDIASVSADRFVATVDAVDIMEVKPSLKVRMARFPEHVRPHDITPQEVRYVIIKTEQ